MLQKIEIFLKKNWLILAIVLLGFFLRAHRYPEFPIAGETADETAWTMLGASLLQTGQPTSWSWFGSYKNFIYQDNGDTAAPFVRPALDHPPLFSLIPGFFHTLKNSWDQIPSMKLIRLPMLFIGAVNIYLLYLVTQKIFKKKQIPYLTAAIYAFMPTFVLSSRLVVAENLLVTWMLLAIHLIKSQFKHKNSWLILISMAAIMTKVSGLVIPLGIIFYGWQEADKKTLKTGLLGLVLGEITYLIYGALFNIRLFLEINLFAQSNRDIGLSTLLNRFFLHPAIVEKIFFDGWIFLGLFALVAFLTAEPKRFLIIKIYSILWLLFIAATAGEQTLHAWYDYPLYPLLVLATGWFIDYLMIKKLYWLTWLSWLLVLPTIRLALVLSGEYLSVSNLIMRLVMGLGALPLGLALLKKDKLAQKSIYLFIYLLGMILLIAGATVILKINARDYWEMSQFFTATN